MGNWKVLGMDATQELLHPPPPHSRRGTEEITARGPWD